MAYEELEAKVYEKMSAEYDALLEEIKKMPPQDIIDNAYQIVMKQDILCLIDNHCLNEPQLRLLLESQLPLDDLYQEWLEVDCTYLEDMEQSITDYLNGRLKTQATEKYCKSDSQIYLKSMREAGEAGEVHEWRASHDRNIQCKLSLIAGITDPLSSADFRLFIQAWTDKYGLARCIYLLSYTIQSKDFDQRFSAEARARASSVVFADGIQQGWIKDYAVKLNPDRINSAMSELIHIENHMCCGEMFSIYQLKDGPKLRDYRFEPLDTLVQNGFAVEAGNYSHVYKAPMRSTDTLESIFMRFNTDRPKDFKGHSLSVSDVVILRRDGKEHAFYCDSVGFAELPDFKSAEAEQKLPQKPKKRDGSER